MDSYIQTPKKVKKNKVLKQKLHEKGSEKNSSSLANDLIAQPDQNRDQNSIESHPKSQKLVELLKDYFQEAGQNINQKTIIFTQNRNSAQELKRLLNTSNENLFRAEVFIGQANSDGNGMNQKVQIETINSFKSGIYNILVATCIGEEGLDIGEVDLIICYDSGFSPIRMIQRMGRTGRQRAGKVFILLMEGKEYQSYVQSQKKHRELNELLKDNCSTDKLAANSKPEKGEENKALTFFDSNPRMVPNEMNPICRIIDGHKQIQQERSQDKNLDKNDIQSKQQSPTIRKSRSANKKNIISNHINREFQEELPITIATLVVDPILSIPQQLQPDEFIQYQWQSPELSEEDYKNQMEVEEEEELKVTENKNQRKQVKNVIKQFHSPEEQKSIEGTRDQFQKLETPSEKDGNVKKFQNVLNEQKLTLVQSNAIDLFSGFSEKLISKKKIGEAFKLIDVKNNQTSKVPLKRISVAPENNEKKAIEQQKIQDVHQINQFEEAEVTFLKKYNPNSIFVNIESKKGKIKKTILEQRQEFPTPKTPTKEKNLTLSQSVKRKSPQNLYQHSHIPRSLYPNFMSLQQSPPQITKNQVRSSETQKIKDFAHFGSDSDSVCDEEEIMKLVKQLGSKQPLQAENQILKPNSIANPNPFCLEIQQKSQIFNSLEKTNNQKKISIKTEEQPHLIVQKDFTSFDNEKESNDFRSLLNIINTRNNDSLNNLMQVSPKQGYFESKAQLQKETQNEQLNRKFKYSISKNELNDCDQLKANEIPSPPKKKLYQIRNEQFKKDLEKEFNAEEWAQREKNKVISEPLTDPKMIRAQKAKKQISAAQIPEETKEIVEKGLSAKKVKELEDANSFIKPFENLFLLLEGDSSESEEIMKDQLGKQELNQVAALPSNISAPNPNIRKENPYSYLQSADVTPQKKSKPIFIKK